MKFEPKTTNFEQKIKKINKDIEKIEIGIGEVEVLQALIEQLMDNHTDLTRISKRADEDPSEGRWVKFEFDRVAVKTVDDCPFVNSSTARSNDFSSAIDTVLTGSAQRP